MADVTETRKMLELIRYPRDILRGFEKADEILRFSLQAEIELAGHEKRKADLENDIKALETQKAHLRAELDKAVKEVGAAQASVAREKGKLAEIEAERERVYKVFSAQN